MKGRFFLSRLNYIPWNLYLAVNLYVAVNQQPLKYCWDSGEEMRGTWERRKGGLVHRVPWTKSREKLQELFQSVCVLFCKYKHCNLF